MTLSQVACFPCYLNLTSKWPPTFDWSPPIWKATIWHKFVKRWNLSNSLKLKYFKILALANLNVKLWETKTLRTLGMANLKLANLQATNFQIVDVRRGMSTANDNWGLNHDDCVLALLSNTWFTFTLFNLWHVACHWGQGRKFLCTYPCIDLCCSSSCLRIEQLSCKKISKINEENKSTQKIETISKQSSINLTNIKTS